MPLYIVYVLTPYYFIMLPQNIFHVNYNPAASCYSELIVCSIINYCTCLSAECISSVNSVLCSCPIFAQVKITPKILHIFTNEMNIYIIILIMQLIVI